MNTALVVHYFENTVLAKGRQMSTMAYAPQNMYDTPDLLYTDRHRYIDNITLNAFKILTLNGISWGCDEAKKYLQSNFIKTNPFKCEFDHMLTCLR